MPFFNFFKKKPAKKLAEPIKNIPLSGFEKFFIEKLSAKIAAIREETYSFQSDLLKIIEQLKQHISELDKASFGGREYATINMVKENFVRRMKSTLEKLEATGGFENYSDIVDFSHRVSTILFELKNSTPKEGFLLSQYFRQQTAKIVSSLKEMEKEANALANFTAGRARNIERYEKSIESKKQILKYTERIRGLKDSILGARKKLERYKEAETAAEKRLASWPGKNQLEEGKKRSANIQQEMESRKSEAINIISYLNNPFKRMRHAIGSKFLDSYFEAPFEAILENEDRFREAIETLKQLLDQKRIELKNRDRKKAEIGLARLPEVFELLKKYRQLQNKKERVDSDISDKEREFMVLEREAVEAKSKKEGAELEIADYKKELESLKALIEKEKMDIEKNMAELFGEEIKLVMED